MKKRKPRPDFLGPYPFHREFPATTSALARLRLRGNKHYQWRIRAVAEFLARLDPVTSIQSGRSRAEVFESIAVAVIAMGDQSYEVFAARYRK